MNRRLENKRVLITGGARGLGRALCLSAAQSGAQVAFTYHRSEEAAVALAKELEGTGQTPLVGCVSATDEQAISDFVKRVDETWGGVDVLVNNAGVTDNYPLALLEAEDFDRVIAVNLRGSFLMAREVLRRMIRQKSGVVLNIGSLAGERMLEAPIHYSASKAGVRGMTESMAKDVARHNVRVLCLAPGLLEGGVGQNLPEHRLNDYLEHCALGRVGTFKEVAAFATFLVSDENSYMTGNTLVMDGGI